MLPGKYVCCSVVFGVPVFRVIIIDDYSVNCTFYFKWPLKPRSLSYHVKHNGSRPIPEAKQHWAGSVLGWVTA